MAEIEVRRLQASDLFTLARIVHNSRDEVERVMRAAQPATPPLHKLGEQPAERPVVAAASFDKLEVGVALIFALLGQANSEIRPWLANMCGLKPNEFDRLPLDETLSVIERIVGQEDWPGFLQRLGRVFRGSLAVAI